MIEGIFPPEGSPERSLIDSFLENASAQALLCRRNGLLVFTGIGANRCPELATGSTAAVWRQHHDGRSPTARRFSDGGRLCAGVGLRKAAHHRGWIRQDRPRCLSGHLSESWTHGMDAPDGDAGKDVHSGDNRLWSGAA